MLKYCKALKFEEDPNYEYLKSLLKEIFAKNKFEYDFKFDWNNQVASHEKMSNFLQLANQQHKNAAAKDGSKKEEEEKYFIR